MADEAANREAFRIQQFYCAKMDAPVYARVCGALADGMTRESGVGTRILDWQGEPTRDALPLRFMGGLHALVLDGADTGLARVFDGEIGDPAAIIAELRRVMIEHDATLLPWLDGPPQTNEPGRSAALMVGLLEIARRHGPRIELLEIGSSAGLNLLIDRYAFDLGGLRIGPVAAPVTITPDWTGRAPDPAPIGFVSVRGSDVQPLDATDPAVEARLAAYVWAETPERAERLHRAIAMQRERPVAVDNGDAADWIEARLAEPQVSGVTRVLMHSVVWQYLPESSANRVRAAMEAAGARATSERPLGWVMMEPDRAIGHQVIRVKSWPDYAEWRVLATSHAHGAWVRNGAVDASEPGYSLPDSAKVRAG